MQGNLACAGRPAQIAPAVVPHSNLNGSLVPQSLSPLSNDSREWVLDKPNGVRRIVGIPYVITNTISNRLTEPAGAAL